MSRYLEFKEDEEGELMVVSKAQRALLGQIVFYPAWKQYVFEPVSHAMFNDECLKDIFQVIQGKNQEVKP